MEELRISGHGTDRVFAAGETELATFDRGEINSRLVGRGNIIMATVHSSDTVVVVFRAGREIADDGAQVGHGMNTKGLGGPGWSDVGIGR